MEKGKNKWDERGLDPEITLHAGYKPFRKEFVVYLHLLVDPTLINNWTASLSLYFSSLDDKDGRVRASA